MKIKALKLVSGEELIVNVLDDQSLMGKLVVKNPLLLVIAPNPQGGIMANFMPWTIVGMGNIPINVDTIVAQYDVPKDVEDNYIANTTGMQIVSGAQTSQILKG